MEADASDAKSPETQNALTHGGSADASNAAEAADAAEAENAAAEGSLIRYFESSSPRDLYPLAPAYGRNEQAAAPKAAAAQSRLSMGVAAAVGLLLTSFGALAVYDHDRQTAMLTRKDQESQTLASAVASLKSRLDDIEATRSKDETADLRKIVGEVRTAAAAARDVGSSITQLNARVDHIEKDQGARFDKLAEKVDQAAAAKLADIAARLDKIEKKSAPAVASAALPAVATPPVAPPRAAATPPAPARPEPAVSNETTGSIEKPKPILRAFAVEDVRDGVALIDTVDGTRTVSAGDFLPGAGRVQRIERRSHGWAVVTTNGLILSDSPPY